MNVIEHKLVFAGRKPLCCINHDTNEINEQTPNQLNTKLCFDNDFVSADNGTDDAGSDLDNEITINPARRVTI